MCDLEGHVRVLLDQEDRSAVRFVDALDDRKDLADDDRSETEGRLVEHHDLRLRHEGAGDGEHLLLTTGQGAGELPGALLQSREHTVDFLDVLVEGIVPEVCTDFDVLEDGHIREDVTSLRTEHDALLHTLRGRHIRDILAVEDDASFARFHQPGNRTQRRGLAGTVRTDQGDDGVIRYIEADALHGFDAAVMNFQILYFQHVVSPLRALLDSQRVPYSVFRIV